MDNIEEQVQTLQKQIDGLLVMTAIYNKIVQRHVDESLGEDLKSIQQALRDIKKKESK